MSPEEFKAARAKLGLSAREMDLVLGLTSGGRHTRNLESGATEVKGAVAVAMRYMLKHGLDKEARRALAA